MKHVKLAIFLAILCVIGLLCGIPYMIATIGDTLAGTKVPVATVIIASVVQGAILAFVLGWLGLMMGEAVGLDAPIFRSWILKTGEVGFQKRDVWQAIILGGIGVLVVIGLELFVFRPLIPELVSMDRKVSPLVGMLTFLQGGVYEEVQLRLFLMTLIVWVLSRVFRKQQGLKPWMYWIGILGAALLFGIAHFPAVQQLFGEITPILFARTIILNGLIGLLCGYLYWKKGLEYAMIAHAVGDIILHGLYA
ncbi:CPBP family intramembrane glutamic endopeptidase [Bacillus sp. OTU530]|uniref:CPBP family intramembrane glutamic endopeptidase n=1 Tax=Bacillus sp. OTU530 TaxID=3043862 RepID=UPI00313C1728